MPNEKNNNIAVLILAAGASTRMGQSKQLLPWGETTLLNHAIAQANYVSEHIFVVLGANKDSIEKTLSNEVSVIFNPSWKQGMGTSIAVGVSKIQKGHLFDALLIMLGDQPLLDGSYLNELNQLFGTSKNRIVATSYGDKNGVPAFFHNSLFNELRKLSKDYGARSLMQRHVQYLSSLNPNGKEIDIDTPETYNQLLVRSK
ncbi:nucleotidyltransferase family protein [Croceitalea rosinachiae]|uniref:Nucleotidyltransferase family protein n=1 Tax=Croceitalea rosinachiae TaxID=3075596 RepID=A0ABU3ABK4_9FLAO|nr:nucleotidyltransferase family protein [Croceitalea sp. F388]MDT0607567.1 nucleotidyltransferase family protein [Croceitalea sp. F388]